MIEQIEIKHTGGVGAFFYASILALLIGALMMYFAFYTGIINWQKAQRIEGRMDNRVGVNGQLEKPVDLIILKKSCLLVNRAYLDGSVGTMYLKNECHTNLNYHAWHWNAVAPDGTIIHQDYSNSINELESGEVTEVLFNVEEDDRISKVIIWTTITP